MDAAQGVRSTLDVHGVVNSSCHAQGELEGEMNQCDFCSGSGETCTQARCNQARRRAGMLPITKDWEPCNHPGCRNHVSHPCEGCGR